MENEETKYNPLQVKLNRLEHALFLISSLHCSDGHEEQESCIYCGTKWPCFTAKVSRKAATYI
jgi:hypothetical protein